MLLFCLPECQLSETLSTCRFAQRMMQVRIRHAARALLDLSMH